MKRIVKFLVKDSDGDDITFERFEGSTNVRIEVNFSGSLEYSHTTIPLSDLIAVVDELNDLTVGEIESGVVGGEALEADDCCCESCECDDDEVEALIEAGDELAMETHGGASAIAAVDKWKTIRGDISE